MWTATPVQAYTWCNVINQQIPMDERGDQNNVF
jgi:hypothetical protein